MPSPQPASDSGREPARFATSDLGEAMQVLTDLYGAPMTLTADPPRGFRFEARAAGAEGLAAGELACAGSGGTTVESFDDFVTAMSVGGDLSWHVDGSRGAGPAPFLMAPGLQMRSEWRELRLLTLRVAADEVRRSREQRGLHGPTDWSRPARDPRYLGATMTHLGRMLRAAPDALADPILAATARESAASAIIATYDDAQTESAGHPMPRAVRRALACIDERLAEPITVTDIAAAAGLTVRALEYAFRRHVGATPSEHLRRARLAAVRDELRRAGPDAVTVAAVARRWGFAHPSRFAGAYRREFGEAPSTTLRG